MIQSWNPFADAFDVSNRKYRSPKKALQIDWDLQDIVVLNLERAVQISVDIALHILSNLEDMAAPGSMAEAFRALEGCAVIDSACATKMIKAVGFRNTAVHTYQKIDYAIVFGIISQHLDDFRTYAAQIDTFNNRTPD